MKITRALISVSDKTGIASFARALERQGVDIISTGGTADLLRKEKIPVREISKFTAFPEVLDGRVKTLHPRVHGGLLFKRGNRKHEAEARECGFEPIDLVVVNLYPFEATIAKPGVKLAEAIENIDIGGPSMIRSAAKNYESVTVVVDSADYDAVLENIRDNDGETTLKLRERLAIKAFSRTAEYDRAISALYGDFDKYFEKLHGKELSFNNILDISAATNLIAEFEEPTVGILKHTNPCGVGSDADLRKAWDKAFVTDKQAPFGGIIVCNRPLSEPLAKVISEIFSEVIIAPDFDGEARAILQKKKNLRLIRLLTPATQARPKMDVRSVCGGVLVQDADVAEEIKSGGGRIVTKRRPTKTELNAMLFGWRVVKHVKSNAIVYAKADRTLGVGAGQMSRIDASRIAVWKAKEAGLSLKGSAIASDAFFPFPDGLIAAADAGATCAIQPGGSVRDKEVIAAANERNMAMIFTGIRHFRH
ncbi:MAG: bifunctional phosphoribosylaminoimidazolecarboxamide formyltransferase/inosine monophosphate cyclohydrolase [Verrucomicrobia bacterium]|nr:MAG: bifunctional phosphoribosylaminoimidazolecarboxamide formyltransferase/inosine monophosphate cyclohydrolase [Verrucomicrobiota bacterium]